MTYLEEIKSKSWFDKTFSRPNQASVGYRTAAATGGLEHTGTVGQKVYLGKGYFGMPTFV